MVRGEWSGCCRKATISHISAHYNQTVQKSLNLEADGLVTVLAGPEWVPCTSCPEGHLFWDSWLYSANTQRVHQASERRAVVPAVLCVAASFCWSVERRACVLVI